MSSFFKETLKARLYQNKAKHPLLKLDDLLGWQMLAISYAEQGHDHAVTGAAIAATTP